MNKQTVLITGGSSGIGFELAKLFSQNNYNLVLVAKDKDKLTHAAETLKNPSTSLLLIAKDLSKTESSHEIHKELQDKNVFIDILVNNAGFATYGLFTETNLQEELNELQVNIVALTHLTKLFAKDMVSKKSGKILNVASTAAFAPGPFMTVYFASKAYVLSFSEALASELEGTGVFVSVLCPGPTDTSFADRAKLEKSRIFKGKKLSAEFVAKKAYEGLMNNQIIIIPSLKDKLMIQGIRLLPRNAVTKLVRRLQDKI